MQFLIFIFLEVRALKVSQSRSRIFSRKVFPYRRRARSVVVTLSRRVSAEDVFFEVSGFCHFQDRQTARLFYSNLQDLIRAFKDKGGTFESAFRKV